MLAQALRSPEPIVTLCRLAVFIKSDEILASLYGGWRRSGGRESGHRRWRRRRSWAHGRSVGGQIGREPCVDGGLHVVAVGGEKTPRTRSRCFVMGIDNGKQEVERVRGGAHGGGRGDGGGGGRESGGRDQRREAPVLEGRGRAALLESCSCGPQLPHRSRERAGQPAGLTALPHHHHHPPPSPSPSPAPSPRPPRVRPPDMDDAAQVIAEATHAIRVQLAQMVHCLDADQLMDALKAASTMLAELRTSALSPKAYYDLYVPVFDALRHLAAYLHDAHLDGRHHLADLYELVQYCGSVVPRLYLMITVGGVYMSIPDAPVQEIMRDMMEMSRGVQHPTRGLFLRNYLSGVTRDHLPTGTSPGPEGSLQDSIGFVLTNFIEMNKLWVRLQHQGPSRERERRESERRELRILIGTNLVRLSELDGVGLPLYRQVILPSILEQVVNCKDVIAQEYLMEVVIQVFPDVFHIRTLSPFLRACSKLHPKVNIKNIVIALINRIAAYAQREAENDNADEIRRQEHLATRRLSEKTRQLRLAARQGAVPVATLSPPRAPAGPAASARQDAPYDLAQPTIATHGGEEEDEGGLAGQERGRSTSEPAPAPDSNGIAGAPGDAPTNGDVAHTRSDSPVSNADQEMRAGFQSGATVPVAVPPAPAPAPVFEDLDGLDENVEKFRGVPVNVPLFEVFWAQVVDLIYARPDLSLPDVTALLVSLLQLSLSCYPDRLEYVDQVLSFAVTQVEAHAQAHDPLLLADETQKNLTKVLALPIEAYTSTLTLLALPHYPALLAAQPYATHKHIAQAIVRSTLKNETVLSTPEDVEGILSLCGTLVVPPRETQASARLPAPVAAAEAEEIKEEQGWLARLVHLFRAEDVDTQFMLLQTARDHLIQGADRIHYTLPTLVFAAVQLARRFKLREVVAASERSGKGSSSGSSGSNRSSGWSEWARKMGTLYKFVHQIIGLLYTRVESNSVSDLCLRLYLLVAQSADACGFEEQAYEFYVQAFTVYEESISESRAQLQAIGLVISTLHTARGFGEENYDRLITKATLHGAKLLKKPHQATAVLMASHLWWQTESYGGAQVGVTLAPHGERRGCASAAAAAEAEAALHTLDAEGSKGALGQRPRGPQPLLRDGKRVLECLQKALRIANSCLDERSTVEIFCSALDQYLYYFEHGVEQIQPRFLNSLVELISAGLDALVSADPPSAQTEGSGLAYPDACLRQFRAQLRHMLTRKRAAQEGLFRRAIEDTRSEPDWNAVIVQGAVAKWGI